MLDVVRPVQRLSFSVHLLPRTTTCSGFSFAMRRYSLCAFLLSQSAGEPPPTPLPMIPPHIETSFCKSNLKTLNSYLRFPYQKGDAPLPLELLATAISLPNRLLVSNILYLILLDNFIYNVL